MRRLKPLFSLLLLFFGCLPILYGATTGKINGKVLDKETGDPLIGANIVLTGTAIGGATGLTGEFVIINIPPGSYDVRASMMGYTDVVQARVKVMVNRTTGLNFSLSGEVLEGQEVIIVAERPIVELDVTGSETVIDADELERTPASQVKDILQQQRGIYGDGRQLMVRGGIAQELNYRVDGISMAGGALGDNWTSMNTTAIQEFSVLTGGYNAEYGQAMSGVINVVTKEGSRTSKNLHGSVKFDHRPAGTYHWGRNFFDRSLYKYTHFTPAYWDSMYTQTRSNRNILNTLVHFHNFTGDPDSLTGDDIYQYYLHEVDCVESGMNDYGNRSQNEYKGSVYGSFLKNTTFLLGGQYKKGVSIWPTAEPYQPEYNLQGKFSVYLDNGKSLTLNALYGNLQTNEYQETGLNNQIVSRWRGRKNAAFYNPYDVNLAHLAMYGANWMKGTEDNTISTLSAKWQHMINPKTFYQLQVDYQKTDYSCLDDYSKYPEGFFEPNEETGYVPQNYPNGLWNHYRLFIYFMSWNAKAESQTLRALANITSQINQHNSIKAGFEINVHDMDYWSFRHEIPEGNLMNQAPNLTTCNVWHGQPIEASAYFQDKIEYSGIILNMGIRVDGFNTNNDYPDSPIFDPLGQSLYNGSDGRLPTNSEPIFFMNENIPGWAGFTDTTLTLIEAAKNDTSATNYMGNRNTLASTWKFAVAPRIGISFPINENSKLRFSYGHFYQRPAWAMFYGQNIRFYSSYLWRSLAPEHNSGLWGNPDLSYEKAIQYEIGYDQNLFNIFRLNVTAYYKDQSRLTRFANSTPSGSLGIASNGNSSSFYDSYMSVYGAGNLAKDNEDGGVRLYANDTFKDSRGIELNLEKLFTDQWAARITMDYSVSSGGKYGVNILNQDPALATKMKTNEETEVDWLTNYRVKGNVSYVTRPDLLYSVLGDISIGVYYEYFSGPEYTYYPSDYEGIQIPLNKRWYPHQRTDLTMTKQIAMGSFTPMIGLRVTNLFNNYDRRIPGNQEELEAWEQEQIIPRHDAIPKANEADVWGFYNSFSNPRRMIYFTVGLNF